MKRTSRRKFGLQFAGALAALPAASLITSQNVSAQEKQRPKPSATEEIQSSHNTPPDVVISDGSLVIESEDELKPKTMGSKIYQAASHPDITHIRVLVDNGDKVYEDLEAKGSIVNVGWENNQSGKGDLKIWKNADNKFTVESDKALNETKPMGKPRGNKYGHPGGGGPNEHFRIAYVAVTNPVGFKTSFSASQTQFQSAEFRVLIWRH